MLKQMPFSSPDGHIYLKCKRCKQQFYVVSDSCYAKTVCFCPYCGLGNNSSDKVKKAIEWMIAKEEEYQDRLDALEEAMNEDWKNTGFQE